MNFEKFLSKHFKYRVIKRDDKTPYLVRYYILRTPFFRLRIHHILRSDYDCLHDHPWNFLSIILKGSYWEYTPRKRSAEDIENNMDEYHSIVHKKAGSIIYHKAEDKHRLEIEEGADAWTLVFMFRRRRRWGFWTSAGWVFHEEYDPKSSCE